MIGWHYYRSFGPRPIRLSPSSILVAMNIGQMTLYTRHSRWSKFSRRIDVSFRITAMEAFLSIRVGTLNASFWKCHHVSLQSSSSPFAVRGPWVVATSDMSHWNVCFHVMFWRSPALSNLKVVWWSARRHGLGCRIMLAHSVCCFWLAGYTLDPSVLEKYGVRYDSSGRWETARLLW
jgi:hypothetical protein